ncbi:MAG: ATP-binding cassette domain-containing protein [Arsenophonus sp.]|nr:MAG: ATP-binding cassette domain-containing protein [Arsenophonus sp.]
MQPLLILKNISININKILFLQNISFSLYPRDILTVIGKNGVGKSTLAKIILGLLPYKNGKIFYKSSLRIGYVPQFFSIDMTIPLTVKRFMTLKKVNIDEIIATLIYVDGEYLINKQMYTLSGGEIQKVLLARSLLDNPELLVLDEPTKNLDINGQKKLYNLIEIVRSKFNCAVFIISHDIKKIMKKTNKILFIKNKQINFSKVKKEFFHKIVSDYYK